MIARSPIRKSRSKPRYGRVKGKAMTALRDACFSRDRGMCVHCKRIVLKDADPMLDYSFHLAHKQAKRRGGDDLSNVECLCGGCHRRQHLWGPTGEKPCPRKEQP